METLFLVLALIMTAAFGGALTWALLERAYAKDLRQRLASSNASRRVLAREVLKKGGNPSVDPKKVLAYLKENRVSARTAQEKVAEVGG